MSFRCAICNSADLRVLMESAVSVTSDTTIVNRPADSTVCLKCATVQNSVGLKGSMSSFYQFDYGLLAESELSDFVTQIGGDIAPATSSMARWFTKNFPIPFAGRVLDVGCGKGLLLGELGASRPDLHLVGVEPSKRAFGTARHAVPSAVLHNELFSVSRFEGQTFDAIFCTGVLEHQSDPVGFLRQLESLLSSDGRLFLSVPNFANNPSDLLTFDHLFRFTPFSLSRATSEAGLELILIETGSGVPMWASLKSAVGQRSPVDVEGAAVSEEIRRSEQAASWLRRALESLAEMGESLAEDETFAAFGTGLLVPHFLCRQPRLGSRLAAFLEENQSIVGSERCEVSVRHVSDVEKIGCRFVVLSANPIYWPRMRKTLSTFSSSYTLWELPMMQI